MHIHYTPTYSSWLNQVENWFARIQRDVITRGIFTSPKDLDKKLMRYIRQYNNDPKPLKWKYDDPHGALPPILLVLTKTNKVRRGKAVFVPFWATESPSEASLRPDWSIARDEPTNKVRRRCNPSGRPAEAPGSGQSSQRSIAAAAARRPPGVEEARRFYAQRAFVRVADQPPHTKIGLGLQSRFCQLRNYAADPERDLVIAMGVVDNLGKGAAGQAVQNANLVCGFAAVIAT